MDVLLLGALAVVLIAITVWIVMWPSRAPTEPQTAVATPEDAAEITPQGDDFEDQYTSATADLSAGAVATTLAEEAREEATAASLQLTTATVEAGGEPWSTSTLARETQPTAIKRAEPTRQGPARRASVGLGAAALLTLGGAIGGAWLYSRWQRERNKPVSRLRRRLIK